MKKRVVFWTLTLLLMSSSWLAAQVAVGVKVGLSNNQVDVADAVEGLTQRFEGLTTPTVGVVADFAVGDRFGFRPELQYGTKGFQLREGTDVKILGIGVPVGVTARTKVRYLEMPLLANYRVGNQALKMNVMVGPSVGYALNGQVVTRANLLLETQPLRTDFDLDQLNYERLEISGVAGLGVSYDTDGGRWFADVRYTHGLTDLYKTPVFDANLQNRNLGVQVGYMVQF